ncbi:MAG: ATP-binding protein, partial [Pseudomonadota bacterium]
AALAAAQMALEKEQRVSAIGAMAEAVAHELGTPLATIKLSASELKRELSDNPDAYEDVLLIAEQADRCRSILAELSAVKAPEDAQIRSAPIMAVLQEAAEPHHNRRAEILFRLNGAPAGPDDPPAPQPDVQRRPELIHGLRNLIQNAADFAASTVWVDVTLDGSGATIAIGDDGAGFSTEILDQLGEPFATTRGRVGEAAGAYVGMGLGVFIAKTLLERTGARLRFENAARTPPRRRAEGASGDARPVRDPGDRPTGAIVRVEWSAEALPLSPPRAAPTDAGATQHAPS